jgi:hypothetical protein
LFIFVPEALEMFVMKVEASLFLSGNQRTGKRWEDRV